MSDLTNHGKTCSCYDEYYLDYAASLNMCVLHVLKSCLNLILYY